MSVLMLCEYATINSDTTCTVLRGGLELFIGELPMVFSGYAFLQIGARELPAGEHVAKIEVVSPQGQLAFKNSVSMSIAKPEWPARYAAPIVFSVQTYGTYTFRVEVAGLVLAETNFCAQEHET